MDIEQGLGNALQNKLILQYLSGVGGAMSAGQPVGPAMDAITQQNIQSQNLLKMLKQMLGPNNDVKGAFDKTGMSVKIPSNLMSEMLQGTGPGGVWEGLAAPLGTPKSTPTPTQEGSRKTTINPFTYSQSNLDGISPSDLAGLTSRDIMGAFGMKQQSIADAADAAYKESLMRKAEQSDILDTEFPVSVPDIGKVTHREWSTLPAEDKSYALYVAGAKNSGIKNIMTKESWKATTPTEKEKFLRSAMSDPKLMKAAKELAESGATRISLGEKLAEKTAMGELEGQLYFNSPKWTDDVDKQVQAFDKDQAWLLPEEDRPLARAKVRVKDIESKIVAGGGTIQNVVMDGDGRTMVWTVKWPSGDVKKIKYAVK